MKVVRIAQPERLVNGLAVAIEKATLEGMGLRNPSVKPPDQKRLLRAERILELLVQDGILECEPDVAQEPGGFK